MRSDKPGTMGLSGGSSGWSELNPAIQGRRAVRQAEKAWDAAPRDYRDPSLLTASVCPSRGLPATGTCWAPWTPRVPPGPSHLGLKVPQSPTGMADCLQKRLDCV